MSKGNRKKQQTCCAINACDQDQMIDIFEESFGYLSYTETFVDRITVEPIDYDTDSIAASDRPLVILDIDNTLLYCKYFADEICVEDNIEYYHNQVDVTPGVVTCVWYRINLQLFDDDIIDDYSTDLIEYDHCHTLPQRLRKKKTFNYPYRIDDESNEILETREALIKGLTVIGCEIIYQISSKSNNKFISFEADSADIQHFVPSLTRKGYDDAAFIYDGFIVRLRYGLDDFIECVQESCDIVLFTAASRSLYEGLTDKLHQHLCDIMGRDHEDKDDKLWKQILFRDDCSPDFDQNGKLFHHKDITKFNKDLSKVIIVDNTALAFKSFEPNAILIKDYFGRNKMDNELEAVLDKLDDIMDIENDSGDQYIDYRYILCGIEQMPSDLGQYDRKSATDILLSTQRFLNDLKESLIQRNLLPNTLNFCEPQASVLDTQEEMKIIEITQGSRAKLKRTHTYTISLQLKDIPHFDVHKEMRINNITSEDVRHSLTDRKDDEDDDEEEEKVVEHKQEEDIKEQKATKEPVLVRKSTVTFSMKPRQNNNVLMLNSIGGNFMMRQRSQRILSYYKNAQNNKKVNELKKRYARPVPPAPPKQKAKRIDNPWVKQLKKSGDNITLGAVMKTVHNKPPPPPSRKRIKKSKAPPPRKTTLPPKPPKRIRNRSHAKIEKDID